MSASASVMAPAASAASVAPVASVAKTATTAAAPAPAAPATKTTTAAAPAPAPATKTTTAAIPVVSATTAVSVVTGTSAVSAAGRLSICVEVTPEQIRAILATFSQEKRAIAVDGLVTPEQIRASLATFSHEKLAIAVDGLESLMIAAATKGAPPRSYYEVPYHTKSEKRCDARILVRPDKRWSIPLYRARYCGEKIYRDGLCDSCWHNNAEDNSGWYGRMHGCIPSWVPLYGSEWANRQIQIGKLRWIGKPDEYPTDLPRDFSWAHERYNLTLGLSPTDCRSTFEKCCSSHDYDSSDDDSSDDDSSDDDSSDDEDKGWGWVYEKGDEWWDCQFRLCKYDKEYRML